MKTKLSLLLLGVFVFTIRFSPLAFSAVLSDDESSACSSRGIIHFVNGDYDEAIAEFTQAVAINPKNALASYQRAKVYEYLDNLDQALLDYSQAIKADPEYISAYYYRGVIYQKSGQIDSAILDYTKIIDSKTSPAALRANAYNNRGLAYDKRLQSDKAISDFTNAIEILPDQLNAYYNRGICYINLQSYLLAKADFEQELQLHPDLSFAKHYKLALAHYLAGEYADAYKEALLLEGVGEKINPLFIEDIKKKLDINK